MAASEALDLTPPTNFKHFLKRVRAQALRLGVADGRLLNQIAKVVVLEAILGNPELRGRFVHVKGGTTMEIFVGIENARVTTDLDISVKNAVAEFVGELESLAGIDVGSDGFSLGSVKLRNTPRPEAVAVNYLVASVSVQTNYRGKTFARLDLDIAVDEFMDAVDNELTRPLGFGTSFSSLGLNPPRPFPIISLEKQIAQKLHALTEPGSDRAKDLYDIAKIAGSRSLNLQQLSQHAKFTFKFRKAHSLPSEFVGSAELREKYNALTTGLREAPSWSEALAILNELLAAVRRF